MRYTHIYSNLSSLAHGWNINLIVLVIPFFLLVISVPSILSNSPKYSNFLSKIITEMKFCSCAIISLWHGRGAERRTSELRDQTLFTSKNQVFNDSFILCAYRTKVISNYFLSFFNLFYYKNYWHFMYTLGILNYPPTPLTN